jgi:rRNA maturation endonuclease Nob1
VKPKRTEDEPAKHDLHGLADEIRNLTNRVRKLEAAMQDKDSQVEWIRKRLGVLLPERYYCRYCKAVIHRDTEACASCGKTLKRPKDPNTGLPS